MVCALHCTPLLAAWPARRTASCMRKHTPCRAGFTTNWARLGTYNVVLFVTLEQARLLLLLRLRGHLLLLLLLLPLAL